MSETVHLHVSNRYYARHDEGLYFTFSIYQLSEFEWGFELVNATGDGAGFVSPSQWPSEDAVSEWLRDSLDGWQSTPTGGWQHVDFIVPAKAPTGARLH